jgi:hypothetical protein
MVIPFEVSINLLINSNTISIYHRRHQHYSPGFVIYHRQLKGKGAEDIIRRWKDWHQVM